MNEIITILVIIILGLFGINVMKSNRIKRQKDEIKRKDATIDIKKEELEKIHEVQSKIKEACSKPTPETKEAPSVGDSDSRIERLNKLHDN